MYFLTQNAKSRGKSTEKTLDYNTEGRHIVNSISFLNVYRQQGYSDGWKNPIA